MAACYGFVTRPAGGPGSDGMSLVGSGPITRRLQGTVPIYSSRLRKSLAVVVALVAVLGRAEVVAGADPVAFLQEGLRRLRR